MDVKSMDVRTVILVGHNDLTHVYGLLMMWGHHRHEMQIHLVDFSGLLGAGGHGDAIQIRLGCVGGVLVLCGTRDHPDTEGRNGKDAREDRKSTRLNSSHVAN